MKRLTNKARRTIKNLLNEKNVDQKRLVVLSSMIDGTSAIVVASRLNETKVYVHNTRSDWVKVIEAIIGETPWKSPKTTKPLLPHGWILTGKLCELANIAPSRVQYAIRNAEKRGLPKPQLVGKKYLWSPSVVALWVEHYMERSNNAVS
jgi:hypothetical protein